MQVVFDWKKMNVLKAQDKEGNWFVLNGECSRCGACCVWENCNHLTYENINDKKVSKCKIQTIKPWHCAIYPKDPSAKLFDSCTFKWEKVNG